MKHLATKINELLSGFTGWLMLAMMLILVVDILWRMFGMPLQGMAEMSVFVMMIVIYLGFARCEEHYDHVGLEFFTNALSDRVRTITLRIAQVLAFLTVALLLYAVVTNAISAFESNESIEGTVEMPTWPTKMIMSVGMFFFLVQAFINIFRTRQRPDDSDEVEEFE